MAKKITVTLSDKAEQQLNDIMYSLDGGKDGLCTLSEAINWALESHADFEENSGTDLISYIQETYEIYTSQQSRVTNYNWKPKNE